MLHSVAAIGAFTRLVGKTNSFKMDQLRTYWHLDRKFEYKNFKITIFCFLTFHDLFKLKSDVYRSVDLVILHKGQRIILVIFYRQNTVETLSYT